MTNTKPTQMYSNPILAILEAEDLDLEVKEEIQELLSTRFTQEGQVVDQRVLREWKLDKLFRANEYEQDGVKYNIVEQHTSNSKRIEDFVDNFRLYRGIGACLTYTDSSTNKLIKVNKYTDDNKDCLSSHSVRLGNTLGYGLIMGHTSPVDFDTCAKSYEPLLQNMMYRLNSTRSYPTKNSTDVRIVQWYNLLLEQVLNVSEYNRILFYSYEPKQESNQFIIEVLQNALVSLKYGELLKGLDIDQKLRNELILVSLLADLHSKGFTRLFTEDKELLAILDSLKDFSKHLYTTLDEFIIPITLREQIKISDNRFSCSNFYTSLKTFVRNLIKFEKKEVDKLEIYEELMKYLEQ